MSNGRLGFSQTVVSKPPTTEGLGSCVLERNSARCVRKCWTIIHGRKTRWDLVDQGWISGSILHRGQRFTLSDRSSRERWPNIDWRKGYRDRNNQSGARWPILHRGWPTRLDHLLRNHAGEYPHYQIRHRKDLQDLEGGRGQSRSDHQIAGHFGCGHQASTKPKSYIKPHKDLRNYKSRQIQSEQQAERFGVKYGTKN
jgi:hypothetical protein